MLFLGTVYPSTVFHKNAQGAEPETNQAPCWIANFLLASTFYLFFSQLYHCRFRLRTQAAAQAHGAWHGHWECLIFFLLLLLFMVFSHSAIYSSGLLMLVIFYFNPCAGYLSVAHLFKGQNINICISVAYSILLNKWFYLDLMLQDKWHKIYFWCQTIKCIIFPNSCIINDSDVSIFN